MPSAHNLPAVQGSSLSSLRISDSRLSLAIVPHRLEPSGRIAKPRIYKTRLLPKGRIADERLRRDLPRVSIASGDNRDIIEAVYRYVLVIRDRSGQRPDFLTLVVDEVHLSCLLCDLCPSA